VSRPEISDERIAAAAATLRGGGLVAFPTETVYGLGADATNADAVARLFDAKNRPRFDPIIVHLADAGLLETVTAGLPPLAIPLAETFWPGPLTMVLPRGESIPPIVSAGLPTVGVRVPDHPVASRLIELAGRPIAAPSANRFGRISPTTASHVRQQFDDQLDVVLDGGPCRVGVESTVLDLTGPLPRLLRHGGVTHEQLQELVGTVEIHQGTLPVDQAAPAPGMLARHYAPITTVVLVERLAVPPGPGCGLLTLTRPDSPDGWSRIEVLSESGDLVEATAGFFAALHRLDDAGLERIVALRFPESGLGVALNDRLVRAASRE
jgi:L-threonylcarbamoyladenylate synthase